MADFAWSADGAGPLLEFTEMSLLKSLLGHVGTYSPYFGFSQVLQIPIAVGSFLLLMLKRAKKVLLMKL